MIDFIVKYWIEFLFGLIISGMGVMAKLMYNQHLKNKAIDKGVEALLRNGIVQTYNKWSERGYCPLTLFLSPGLVALPYNLFSADYLQGVPSMPLSFSPVRRTRTNSPCRPAYPSGSVTAIYSGV